jgi:hypothetical protein
MIDFGDSEKQAAVPAAASSSVTSAAARAGSSNRAWGRAATLPVGLARPSAGSSGPSAAGASGASSSTTFAGPVKAARWLDRGAGHGASHTGSAGAAAAPVIRRKVRIEFQTRAHEMEDPPDPLTAKILIVDARRDPKRVSTENDDPDGKQWAHVTSHTVMTNMWVRALDQKTWLGAWKTVQRKTLFLQQLVEAWYSDARGMAKDKKAWLKRELNDQIAALLAQCGAELQRGDVKLEGGAWGAKPKGADHSQWAWFDHQPTKDGDGIDPDTHDIRQWKPLLDSANVNRLQEACETWMTLRGQMPWTSVKAESYVKGEVNAPTGVEDAATGVANAAAPTAGEVNAISTQVLRSFDFFPDTGSTWGLVHAGATAARHLVEHFEYHPSIKPAWRLPVKTRFLELWKARVITDIATEQGKARAYREYQDSGRKAKSSRQSKKASPASSVPEPGRDVTSLEQLRDRWDDLEAEFDRTYTILAAALA